MAKSVAELTNEAVKKLIGEQTVAILQLTAEIKILREKVTELEQPPNPA